MIARSRFKMLYARIITNAIWYGLYEEYLKFHTNKLMVVQKLNALREKRMSCYNDILQNVLSNFVLLASDGSHFHVSGYVNKQIFINGRVAVIALLLGWQARIEYNVQSCYN